MNTKPRRRLLLVASPTGTEPLRVVRRTSAAGTDDNRETMRAILARSKCKLNKIQKTCVNPSHLTLNVNWKRYTAKPTTSPPHAFPNLHI